MCVGLFRDGVVVVCRLLCECCLFVVGFGCIFIGCWLLLLFVLFVMCCRLFVMCCVVLLACLLV